MLGLANVYPPWYLGPATSLRSGRGGKIVSAGDFASLVFKYPSRAFIKFHDHEPSCQRARFEWWLSSPINDIDPHLTSIINNWSSSTRWSPVSGHDLFVKIHVHVSRGVELRARGFTSWRKRASSAALALRNRELIRVEINSSRENIRCRIIDTMKKAGRERGLQGCPLFQVKVLARSKNALRLWRSGFVPVRRISSYCFNQLCFRVTPFPFALGELNLESNKWY